MADRRDDGIAVEPREGEPACRCMSAGKGAICTLNAGCYCQCHYSPARIAALRAELDAARAVIEAARADIESEADWRDGLAAALARVVRERDEARRKSELDEAQCDDMTEEAARMAEAVETAERQRDEARAEAARLRSLIKNAVRDLNAGRHPAQGPHPVAERLCGEIGDRDA